MAVLVVVLVICAAFVGLTRLTLSLPSQVMDGVLVGLGFFLVPCLVIYPPAAPLWATCLFGVWSISDSARVWRFRLDARRVPDGVPKEWRIP
jgi:hypothetical protein